MMDRRALEIPWKEKLKLCVEILTTGTVLTYIQSNKKDYIFRKGYEAGFNSIRAPSLYEVVVTIQGHTEDIYEFDNLNSAVNFAKEINLRDSEPYDYITFASLRQTYLPRDLDHLIY